MQQNGVRANIVCKYFKEGNCFRGEACLFSHDLGMENICRFYLQGSCAFGNHCRYTHQRHPNKKNLQKLEMDPKISTGGSSVLNKNQFSPQKLDETDSSNTQSKSWSAVLGSSDRIPADKPMVIRVSLYVYFFLRLCHCLNRTC